MSKAALKSPKEYLLVLDKVAKFPYLPVSSQRMLWNVRRWKWRNGIS